MERKVMQVGKSSLVVTLPRAWTKKANLLKGSSVSVEETPSGALLVKPATVGQKQIKETVIDITRYQIIDLEKLIVARYLSGADEIVLFSSTPMSLETVEATKNIIRRFSGTEIIETSTKRIVIRDMIGSQPVPMTKLLTRLDNMTRNYFDGLNTGLTSANPDEFRALSGFYESDKLYLLLLKKLILASKYTDVAISLKITLGQAVVYTLVVKNLKEILEELESLINVFLGGTVLSTEHAQTIACYLKRASEDYVNIMRAMYKEKEELILDAIRDIDALHEEVEEFDTKVDYFEPELQQPIEDALFSIKTILRNTKANGELLLALSAE